MSEATTGVAVAIASSGVSPKPSNVLGQTTTSAGREAVTKIGKASCRGRGENSVVAGSFKKKKKQAERGVNIGENNQRIDACERRSCIQRAAQVQHREDENEHKPG